MAGCFFGAKITVNLAVNLFVKHIFYFPFELLNLLINSDLLVNSLKRGRESNHARRKGPYESNSDKGKLTRDGRVQQCSRCKQEGHNKRWFNNPIAVQEKRPRGRPRKFQVFRIFLIVLV